MGQIIEVEDAIFKEQDGAPAESVTVTGIGIGGKSDEAELYQHPGILSMPEGEEICAIIEVGEQKIIVGTQNYRIGKTIDKGELFLYSVADGVVKAFLFFSKDGDIELNGNGDYAVRFNELKTGFDQLKSDFNNFITTFNTHVHPTAAPGPPSPPPSSGTSSTASIDNAKVDSVKIEGV